ncbi:helix-turn-helix domain-containing protein [Erythrobacter sp. Alg231-14]|uniref:helix-turn-helix domain-containing protein n=1 Tax=Erythrobacter sp. Alg231-14 TaxID=1922225 RepID=UPI000D54C6D6
MPIVTNLDVMMAKRKISLKELAERIGISNTNLSLLKTGKVQGVRYRTLEALCHELDCQPGDILEYRPSDEATPHAADAD